MELDEYRRMAQVEASHWWYGETRKLLTEVLGPLLPPGGRFLDAGCGTGATGGWMEARGGVIGVDHEPLALRLHREAHDAKGLVAADVARLPLRSESFDAALCVTVLYHQSVSSVTDAVAELVRTLRPGGVICLMEPGVRRLRRAHDRVTHTARRFSRCGLAQVLEANGCDIVRSTGAYTFLVPAATLKAVLERGRTASDLDRRPSGGGGLLARLAATERALLRRRSAPFGLSVLTVGRRRMG